MGTLKNGSKYTFATIAPAILGHNFRNMVLEGELSYRLAARTYPVDTTAAAVAAYLPEGISQDQTTYTYYLFRSEDSGSDLLIASEWIRTDSIQESLDTYQDIRIHGASQKDIAIIKNIRRYKNSVFFATRLLFESTIKLILIIFPIHFLSPSILLEVQIFYLMLLDIQHD